MSVLILPVEASLEAESGWLLSQTSSDEPLRVPVLYICSSAHSRVDSCQSVHVGGVGGLINPTVISGNRDISCDLYLLVKSPLTAGTWDRKQEKACNLQERKYCLVPVYRLICCFSLYVRAVSRPQTVRKSVTSARALPAAVGRASGVRGDQCPSVRLIIAPECFTNLSAPSTRLRPCCFCPRGQKGRRRSEGGGPVGSSCV